MKPIIIILLAGLSASYISSCNDSSAKMNETRSQAPLSQTGNDNVVTFKVNNKPVKTSGWTISRFKLITDSKESLNITTDMHEETRTLDVNIDAAEPGAYVVKGNSSSGPHFYGSYYPDYMNDLAGSYSFETGTFTITEVDTLKNRVNGSFSGIVRNLKGESFNITDGKIINGRLTPGVTIYE
jgi:hypothetical protein